MKRTNLTELLIFIVSAELIGALSALVAGGDFKEYYNTLSKPPLAPPSIVFPIAWALLYAVTAFGAYLVNNSGSVFAHTALRIYALQLAVNFLWTPVFFRLRSFAGALAVAAILFILIALMTFWFYRSEKKAALTTVPYLLWSGYALYLSIGFLIMNK